MLIGPHRLLASQPRPLHDVPAEPRSEGNPVDMVWTVVIGFIAGVIARLITPGKKELSGFLLTTILGITAAVVATYLGQEVGWYRVGEGAALIAALIGAVIVLVIWAFLFRRRSTSWL